jgi:HEPN domain-containing protein
MLTNVNRQQLQPVIDTITSIMKPEKIFLLGASMVCDNTENIFNQQMLVSCTVKEYQLFIISPDSEKRSTDELHDIIESNCRAHTPVTAIVIPLQVFNQWMAKGHLLAHTVYHTDCLVYDKGAVTLKSPGNYNVEDLQHKVRKEFDDWTGRAVEFLIGVETFRSRRQYNIGAFLLHQAAELAYMAAVRLVTGYRAGTHNLDRLMRYAIPFCGAATNVFPRNNDKERKLFKLLQKAYIHGRYKDDFVIAEKEFILLFDRVQHLLTAVRNMGRQKLPEQ